ncbi:MAG: glycosyl transferase [Calditrichaeota bacterium]|nr:glycosyl transferase [Calditrichota bacterium]
MADFFQNGVITTLHKLTEHPTEQLEEEILYYSKRRPIALILPSLYSEIQGQALPRIVDELKKVPYLSEIVVGLDRASKEEFEHAKKFFSQLPQPTKIIWQRSPRIQDLYDLLDKNNLFIGTEGKGRNVWLCMGYLLASNVSRVFAIHDCDILTYNRSLLARLVYPVTNSTLNFRFCKGYYSRVSDRMHGRVSRLFITPLIRSLKKILGPYDYLDYIDSFRYPLSGEMSMIRDVAVRLRLPTDWGLEIGTLNEIYRNYAKNQICQVDIIDRYDHKHQELSEDNPNAGLAKMSIDIAKSFYRMLASMGVVFSDQFFRTIKATFLRNALDFLDKYYVDAMINGLKYDRHSEEKTIEVFLKSIIIAGDQFLANPMELPMIPGWSRIESALPEFMPTLKQVVDEENE